MEVGERAVIFQHNYPCQIWEEFAGPGIDDWRAVVQSRPIQAILCGHTHYGQIADDGRNAVIATRSIGDPEGGPPGYTIGYLHGEDLALTYREPGEDGPVVLVTHPRATLLVTGPRHVVTCADEFRLRTWSLSPVVEVRGRLDDGDWFPFDPRGAGDWAAPLAGDRLGKGDHGFEVEALDRDGGRGGQRIDFTVDPTGRYRAVPFVQPRVKDRRFDHFPKS